MILRLTLQKVYDILLWISLVKISDGKSRLIPTGGLVIMVQGFFGSVAKKLAGGALWPRY
jgi:hypothetical protein